MEAIQLLEVSPMLEASQILEEVTTAAVDRLFFLTKFTKIKTTQKVIGKAVQIKVDSTKEVLVDSIKEVLVDSIKVGIKDPMDQEKDPLEVDLIKAVLVKVDLQVDLLLMVQVDHMVVSIIRDHKINGLQVKEVRIKEVESIKAHSGKQTKAVAGKDHHLKALSGKIKAPKGSVKAVKVVLMAQEHQ